MRFSCLFNLEGQMTYAKGGIIATSRVLAGLNERETLTSISFAFRNSRRSSLGFGHPCSRESPVN